MKTTKILLTTLLLLTASLGTWGETRIVDYTLTSLAAGGSYTDDDNIITMQISERATVKSTPSSYDGKTWYGLDNRPDTYTNGVPTNNSYWKFTAFYNGTLSIYAYIQDVNKTVVVYDEDGKRCYTKTSQQGYQQIDITFEMVAGKTYYMYPTNHNNLFVRQLKFSYDVVVESYRVSFVDYYNYYVNNKPEIEGDFWLWDETNKRNYFYNRNTISTKSNQPIVPVNADGEKTFPDINLKATGNADRDERWLVLQSGGLCVLSTGTIYVSVPAEKVPEYAIIAITYKQTENRGGMKPDAISGASVIREYTSSYTDASSVTSYYRSNGTGDVDFRFNRYTNIESVVVYTKPDLYFSPNRKAYVLGEDDTIDLPELINNTGSDYSITGNDNTDVIKAITWVDNKTYKIANEGIGTLTVTAGSETARCTFMVKAQSAAGEKSGDNTSFAFSKAGIYDETSVALNGLTLTFGNTTNKRLVYNKDGIGYAVKLMDDNGYYHKYPFGDKQTPEVGTYYQLATSSAGIFTAKVWNTATTTLTDQAGHSLPFTTNGHEISIYLEAGKTYYLYNDDASESEPLYLSSFSYQTLNITSNYEPTTYVGFEVVGNKLTITDQDDNDISPQFSASISSINGYLTQDGETIKGAAEGKGIITYTITPNSGDTYPTFTRNIEVTVLSYEHEWDFTKGITSGGVPKGWGYDSHGYYYNTLPEYASVVNSTTNDDLEELKGLLLSGNFRLYTGTGTYLFFMYSQHDAIKIPVKAGMMITMTGYMGAPRNLLVTEVTDIYNDAMDIVNVSTAVNTNYYFIAKEDGYVTIDNQTTNQNFYLQKIKVGPQEMLFTDSNAVTIGTEKEEYSNPVLNSWDGANVTYSIVEMTPSDLVDESTQFTSASGTFTVTGGYTKTGTIKVRATSDKYDLLHKQTSDYIISVNRFEFDYPTLNRTLNIDTEMTEVINNTHNDVNDKTEIPTFYCEVIAGGPKAYLSQTPGTRNYTLQVKGVGTVRVYAQINYLIAHYDVVVTGAAFNETSPGIPYGQTTYKNVIESGLTDVTYSEVEKSKSISYTSIGSDGTITGISGWGVIRVRAQGKDATNTVRQRDYVLTVQHPIDESHDYTWNFYEENSLHNYNADATDNQGTVLTPSKDATNWTLEYRVKEYNSSGTLISQADEIYAYQGKKLEGDNGFIIPETIGLQIDGETGFGVMTTGDDNSRVIALKTGSSLTIPGLKAGQYIEILWERHSDDNGEYLSVQNLTDIEDNPITEDLRIGRRQNEISHGGYYTFKVKNDGEVTFSVIKNGWVDISLIRVYQGDFQSHMREMYWEQTTTNIATTPAPSKMLYDGSTDATYRNISYTYANNLYSAVAPSRVRVTKTDGLDLTIGSNIMTSSKGAKYTYPTVSINDGYGKYYVTYKSYSEDYRYVIDTKTYQFTVGLKPHQTYPYTWDFTNVAGGTLKDNEENAYNSIKADTNNWRETSSGTYEMKVDEDSYYVPGATVVSTDRELLEFDGLGFETPAGLTIQTAEQSVSPAPKRIPSTGGKKLSCPDDYKVTIPDLTNDHVIYISSALQPKAISAHATFVDTNSDANTTNKVWKYTLTAIPYGTKEAIEVTFPATDIYAIGVTNIMKTMHAVSNVGWATESRDVNIDYNLTGYFTKNDAYANTADYGSYDLNTASFGLSKIDDGYVDHETEASGLVLKQDNTTETGTYTVPLFVPATTTPATAIATTFSGSGNLMSPNVTSQLLDSETETIDGTNYTRFILTKNYWTFSEDDETSTDEAKPVAEGVAGFYRLHIWTTNPTNGNTQDEENTMPAHSAWLNVPTGELPKAVWERQPVTLNGIAIRSKNFDNPTDIDADQPTAHRTTADDAWYTMTGIRLTERPTQPGLYIHQGCKIVVSRN